MQPNVLNQQQDNINNNKQEAYNKALIQKRTLMQKNADFHMRKSGVKASFERGQQSQMLLFESFKTRNQFENESVDDVETFTIDQNRNNILDQDRVLQPSKQRLNQLRFPFSQSQNFLEETNKLTVDDGAKNQQNNQEIPVASQESKNKYKKESESSSSLQSSSKKSNEPKSQNANLNEEKEENKITLNPDKSPIPKSMLYSRRGSRRIPGAMNISGAFARESILNTTNNHGKDVTNDNKGNQLIGHKSGFFFALKMKQFANHLVSKLQSRRYNNLRARHLQFFNDKTIVPNDQTGVFKNTSNEDDSDEHEATSSMNLKKKISSFLKSIYVRLFSEQIKHYFQSIPLFLPSHTLKLLWDSINMISISYYLIFFPLRIAFGLGYEDSMASYFALGVLILDIFIYLNTGFYDKGALITDRIQIFIHYLDSRFFTDLFSMVPFVVYNISSSDSNFLSDPLKFLESIISLLFLVRVNHLGQIKKKIEERFYQNKTLTHVISLFTLLATALYIAHLFSCMWIIIAEFRLSTQNTWMQLAKVDQETWIIQYLYSLYFLIITMTTVGYGDIRPQNDIEHLVIIIIVLISSGVFSFSINRIGSIVSQMSFEKEKLKETLQVINNYMNKKNINMSLQQQIREYLEYYLKESIMNDNETEDKIIDMLSEPLKRSLMIEANKIALKDSPIFRNNFSESTISKTVSLIQELRCTPEEVLFYEGDIDDSAIYFVQQGKVELFIDSYNGEPVITSLKVFSKGSSFGETSFFTGAPRGISIRSIDFTTLLMIKRQEFLNVVKENTEDYENFCKIRDKITFYKNFDDLGIKCISCNNKNHFLNDCPFIHYVADKEKIIKMHQLPSQNERQKEIPNKVFHTVTKYNTLGNLDDVLNYLGAFLENMKSYLEKQDWYDGNLEDEEEYEIYNQYDDDEEDEEEDKNQEGDIPDINLKYVYQQKDPLQNESNRHEQYLNQNSLTHPSAIKENSFVPSQNLEKMSYKKDDNQFLQNPPQNAGETHSYKGYRQYNNLEIEGQRERASSNLGLNELSLTPSGLVLNLINPNPGNIRESSQKLENKKRSASNSNLNVNVNSASNPQLLIKSTTLNDDYNQQVNPSINNIIPTPLLSSLQNVNSINPLNSTPIKESTNNYSIKQSSLARANSLVRRNTKRKNTEKTARSTHKRKSTKKTIDSKMNIQASTSSYQNDRKPYKKLTVIRKGFQENQIQNTLLALQGMENILLQNKSNSNSNEFDIMKNFEIYFPHNNVDVVIFQIRKKNPHLYAKSKSFVKSPTKKLFGAMTMNSQHNRMSKMDMVLQKFLQSELEDDKDKESLVSASRQKSQTFVTHKTDHFKTPKQSDWQSRNTRINDKKASYNNSHNDILELQGSPIPNKSRAKSMKMIQQHGSTNQDNFSRVLNNQNDDAQSLQHTLHHDDIYLEPLEKQQQTFTHIQVAGQQSSMISSKVNSHNQILIEESSPKKNVSFQENNFKGSNLNI
ncbi:hypothetical protein ABPG73_015672 [Tetrahymena malaccensis]